MGELYIIILIIIGVNITDFIVTIRLLLIYIYYITIISRKLYTPSTDLPDKPLAYRSRYCYIIILI